MSDTAVAADVTPAPQNVPVETDPVTVPQPVTKQAPEPPPEKPDAPSKSANEALQKAVAKSREKAEAPQKAEPAKEPAKAKEPAPEPAKADVQRAPDGKFVAKDEGVAVTAEGAVERPAEPQGQRKAHDEAPPRFSADGKAAWAEAPESVRAETHRMLREFDGHREKHQPAIDSWNELSDYANQASQQGTTIKAALDNYTGIEKLLRQSPVVGLERIVGNLNLTKPDGSPVTFRDIAAAVIGQKPDQAASRQEATIAELRRELSTMKQEIGKVSETVNQTRESTVASLVQNFASKPEHARFDELGEDIDFFLTSGKIDSNLPAVKRLEEAYKLAERLNPEAPTSQAPLTPAAIQDPLTPESDRPPLNPAGRKSVSGSPPSGSSPATTPGKDEPVPDVTTALKRAAAKARR